MPVVVLDRVSVSFPIYESRHRSMRRRVLEIGTGGRIGADRHRRTVIQALNDVSLRFADGDRVALVGHNGAGKTTLLRVLGGIYEPVAGAVVVRGKAVALLDVAIGMDGDMSGYENIVLRGLMLGMSRAELDRRIDEIADFTDLGPYLNMPFRTYSAGMQYRLAFAVSTSVTPDVLLLDEAMGGGDLRFLAKAKERLAALVGRSRVLVLASHVQSVLRDTCNKAVLLEHGAVVAFGPIDEVLDLYARRTAAA